MAIDLSNILDTDPPNAETVSTGASRIRDTRTAILTSFAVGAPHDGTVQSGEHYEKGPHRFPNGDGSFPFSLLTAGNLGRIFIDTVNDHFLLDNGTNWVALRAARLNYAFTVGSIVIGASGSFVVIQSFASVNIPSGGRIFLVGSFDHVPPASIESFSYRIRVDATTVMDAGTHILTTNVASQNLSTTLFACSTSLTSGNHSFQLEAANGDATTWNANNRFLAFLIV